MTPLIDNACDVAECYHLDACQKFLAQGFYPEGWHHCSKECPTLVLLKPPKPDLGNVFEVPDIKKWFNS